MNKFVMTVAGLAAISFFIFVRFTKHQDHEKLIKVGIVVPVHHSALEDIVNGFKSKAAEIKTDKKIIIDVQNASGDLNMMHSIIKNYIQNNYNFIVPVAKTPAQMAISMIAPNKIIALAANLEEHECAAVFDEIPSSNVIDLAKVCAPNLKTATIIHSMSDKILPEVEIAEARARKKGIKVEKIAISSLFELATSLKSINENTQAILILKDCFIASGIDTISAFADEKNIPIITLDEGTVRQGATCSIGIYESETGASGAILLKELINGKAPRDIHLKDKLHIFVNKEAAEKTKIDLESLNEFAKKKNCDLVIV